MRSYRTYIHTYFIVQLPFGGSSVIRENRNNYIGNYLHLDDEIEKKKNTIIKIYELKRFLKSVFLKTLRLSVSMKCFDKLLQSFAPRKAKALWPVASSRIYNFEVHVRCINWFWITALKVKYCLVIVLFDFFIFSRKLGNNEKYLSCLFLASIFLAPFPPNY